jgi:hypothetical protein
VPDLFHMDYLNQFGNEFSKLSSLLSKGPRNKSVDEFWTRLRILYESYCKLNGITAFYNFDDYSSWKGFYNLFLLPVRFERLWNKEVRCCFTIHNLIHGFT